MDKPGKHTQRAQQTKMMTRLLPFPVLLATILLTLFVVPASTFSSANSDPTPPLTPPSTRTFSAVVVNTLEGATYALRTKDGSLLWKIKTGSPLISSTFRVGAGGGIVPGVDGSLFSLNSNGLQQFPVTMHDLLQGSYLINDVVAYVYFHLSFFFFFYIFLQ